MAEPYGKEVLTRSVKLKHFGEWKEGFIDGLEIKAILKQGSRDEYDHFTRHSIQFPSSPSSKVTLNLNQAENYGYLQWLDDLVDTSGVKEEGEIKAEPYVIVNTSTVKNEAHGTDHGEILIEEEQDSKPPPAKRIKTRDSEDSGSLSSSSSDDVASNDDGDLLANAQVDIIPKAIKSIVELMDELDPGHRYFERQVDTRDECSKLRGKLRKFARENPEHLATAHWINTNKWEPPDIETLRAFMMLIRDIINNSWRE